MERIEAGEFEIRPTGTDDLPLLLAWHSDPDIHRFWDRRPLTEEEIVHKYLGGRLPSVRCFIIESPPAHAVGFIQHADLDQPGDVGIDMFLVPMHAEWDLALASQHTWLKTCSTTVRHE